MLEGNIVYLPTEQMSNYAEVKKVLQNAGAKYKRNTFVFPKGTSAKAVVNPLINGKYRNIKKEFQFFQTPKELAEKLVELAEIKRGALVLEPSAGRGAIIEAIQEKHSVAVEDVHIDYYELMPENVKHLEDTNPANFIGYDFLSKQENPKPHKKYHNIVANPPFNKNQATTHIQQMYEHLHSGGILVSIADIGWMYATIGKGRSFRHWLDSAGIKSDAEWHQFCNIGHTGEFERSNGDDIYIEILGAGEFKQSGTNVRTCIIKIKKA